MSVSDKVKAVLSFSGKKQIEFADYLGIVRQNLATKMQRDSWPASDLIKVAEFTGAKVGFVMPDGTCIFLEKTDIKEKNADDPTQTKRAQT